MITYTKGTQATQTTVNFKDIIIDKVIHVGSVARPSAQPFCAPPIGRCFAITTKALAMSLFNQWIAEATEDQKKVATTLLAKEIHNRVDKNSNIRGENLVAAVIADKERMGFVEQNVLPICSCDSTNDIRDLFSVLVKLQNYKEMPPQSLKHAPTLTNI